VQHWLDKLNGVLLPFYLLGLLAAVVMATRAYGYSDAWLNFGPAEAAPTYGWVQCFAFYLGSAAYMMATFDFARFGRPRDVRYHGLFNFGVPFWLMTFVVN
ncbi:allantoin permease, partial [Pandoraea sputorum]